VVLTGGTVGIDSLRAVAASPVRDAVDWSGVHLWWGDERFLPDGHADRNETQAREALIDVLGDALPAENVHPMPALSDEVPTPEVSAALYADSLAAAGNPAFDVLLLGMGPDGHVASLFPGHEALGAQYATTVAVHGSPKPPPLRVSLTFDAIRRAREVWVVAAGAEKADAVASALGGASVTVTPAVGALGTVYALSATGDALATTLTPMISATWSLPTALSLLAWYVFAPQCISTLSIVRRETNSWKPALAMAGYMFGLAYLGSFATYQLSRMLIGG